MQQPGTPTLAEVLKEARERTGLSQYDLEDKSGVSRATIANIERGETGDVKLSTLDRLAGALGIGIRDLIPCGVTPIAPLIDKFLASDYGQDARPTEDEIAWLRALAPIEWLGGEPTEKTIDRLLDALRSSQRVRQRGR